jgi:hypothetical protein
VDLTTGQPSTSRTPVESTINWDPTRIHKTSTESPTTQKLTTFEPTTIHKTSTESPTTQKLTTFEPTTIHKTSTEKPTTQKLTTFEPTTTSSPSTSTDGFDEPCPEGWLYDNEFTSRCYWVQPSTGWENDQKDCESMESTLVNVHSEAENAVIKRMSNLFNNNYSHF